MQTNRSFLPIRQTFGEPTSPFRVHLKSEDWKIKKIYLAISYALPLGRWRGAAVSAIFESIKRMEKGGNERRERERRKDKDEIKQREAKRENIKKKQEKTNLANYRAYSFQGLERPRHSLRARVGGQSALSLLQNKRIVI